MVAIHLLRCAQHPLPDFRRPNIAVINGLYDKAKEGEKKRGRKERERVILYPCRLASLTFLSDLTLSEADLDIVTKSKLGWVGKEWASVFKSSGTLEALLETEVQKFRKKEVVYVLTPAGRAAAERIAGGKVE